MPYGKKFISWILCSTFLLGVGGTAKARTSVYVVSNTETSELQAYKVEDTNLVHQKNYVCESDPLGDTGAAGLAVNESGFLFVTFEGLPVIEIVNAKTILNNRANNAIILSK